MSGPDVPAGQSHNEEGKTMNNEIVSGAAGIGPGDMDKRTDLREQVTHPAWCDRSRCTAPKFVPIHESDAAATGAGPSPKDQRYGEHRSAKLPLQTSISLGEEMGAWLVKVVCPWETSTFLRFGTMNPNTFMMGGQIELNYSGPGGDLYDLMAQGLAEGAAKFPTLYEQKFPHLLPTVVPCNCGQAHFRDCVSQRATFPEDVEPDVDTPRDPVELEEMIAEDSEDSTETIQAVLDHYLDDVDGDDIDTADLAENIAIRLGLVKVEPRKTHGS